MKQTTSVYEVRPRKDKRGVELISDVLPFGRLWHGTLDNAIGYAMHSSRSHDAVIWHWGSLELGHQLFEDTAGTSVVDRNGPAV
jgi:hypothetical protein